MSSWVSGPDRGLAPVQKEEGDINDPEVTFAPALMSDPSLREKAKSSAYGSVVPKIEKVVLERHDLRPWEEQPSFRPELPEDELRSKAKSSNYGVAVPKKEVREVASPSFKPELITQTSKVSQAWAEKASSSKYGKEVASPSRPKTAPAPSFTPELPKSSYREKYQSSVQSSKYGKVSLPVAERPSTAPSRELNLDGVRSNGKRAHTAESPTKDLGPDLFESRASGAGFVLDGVHVAECFKAAHRGAVIRENLGSPRQLPHAARTRAMTESAKSSRYGEAPPPRGEKPAPKESEAHLVFDRKSLLDTKMERFQVKSPLNEKVHSKGYGTSYTPEKGERPTPKPSDPLWASNLSVKPLEPPPVPRSELNDKVASHSYGTASPDKGERRELVPEPVWVPPSKAGGIPHPERFVRSSSAYDQVRSHYGKDYSPSANGSVSADATY